MDSDVRSFSKQLWLILFYAENVSKAIKDL
jgi:hypothetical protein